MATIIDDITQSISTIPPLRLTETVINLPADEDDFVAKYEANNAHLVNNLVPELNTLKTQLNTTIGQINTVSDEIITAESLISPHYVAIEAVNANATNINAVNANSTNINAVVANQTNINAVALNEANINAVNANKTNIDLVALNETNINNVSTNMPKITNLDTNMSDVNLVADAITGGTLPTIINDAGVSSVSTWSSSKIESQISTAVGSIDLSSKQDVLVSGTNIKTVNSTSILGAGNLAIAGVVASYQEFTTSGTWTKPDGCNYVYVEALGGGGSGAKNASTSQAGGGSGGEFVNKIFKSSDISSSITITIGSGGTPVSTNTVGNDGGDTSFGNLLLAYGGVGGKIVGGNGAGFKRATRSTFDAASAASFLFELFLNAGYGGARTFLGNGGNAIYGGAGGGSTEGGTVYTGGTSLFSGNGGNAGNDTTTSIPTSGATPSGGGGGANGIATQSGAGGNGLVRVYTW